jgi:hypothetical protein
MKAACPTVQIGEQLMSVGYAIIQSFIHDGWEYVQEAYPGALEKLTRGEEILWLQLPAAIDGIVFEESYNPIKAMLEAISAVSVINSARTAFPEWSMPPKETKEPAA